MDIKIKCFSCSKENTFVGSVSRRDECEFCGADMKCCMNCAFYDKNSYNECRESSAEVQLEKERANYCDYFQPGTGASAKESKDDLMAAAEALFKK